MRFLVISKPKHLTPPEATVPLIDAFLAWIDKYSKTGQLESIWSFAGSNGGGGVANVDSAEEMDAIMAEYPFAVFSDIEMYPLVNVKEALQRRKQIAQTMAQMRSG
jgi:muconolactone delta-isomerase